MNLIFFIKSDTIELDSYTIKDIPGSTGRLDVISRCILAALIADAEFDKNIQIWTFLKNYSTFIFNSDLLNYQMFPKNELLLSNYLVNLIKRRKLDLDFGNNPLERINISEINLIDAVKQFLNKKYSVFILHEKGDDFLKQVNELKLKKNILFILGDQSGEFLNSKELLKLNLPSLSFGSQSYLASSIIRLIKLNLLY